MIYVERWGFGSCHWVLLRHYLPVTNLLRISIIHYTFHLYQMCEALQPFTPSTCTRCGKHSDQKPLEKLRNLISPLAQHIKHARVFNGETTIVDGAVLIHLVIHHKQSCVGLL